MKSVVLMIVCGISSSAWPVYAQQAAGLSDGVLEEITVSAQKRTERLQDVPVPISVIDAQTLADSNLDRIQDFYTTVPGLTVTPGPQSVQILSIRGITTGFSNPTVGVTVDDVPYGGSNLFVGQVVPDIDPGDLAHVEVLRGPQGTLYGANSLGGLLKFVTVDPSTDGYSGRVEAGTSGVQNGAQVGYNFRASGNIPVSDTIALRASGFARQDPGYIDNPVLGINGINEDHVAGGRLAALWRPMDQFSIKVSAMYQETKGDGLPDVDVGPGLAGLQQSYLIGVGPFDRRAQAYAALMNLKLGSLDLTSISGYNINAASGSQDYSYAVSGIAQQVFQVQGVPLFTYQRSTKFTQEVRLASPADQTLYWLLGVFYTKENDHYDQIMDAEDPTTGQIVGQGNYDRYPTTYEEYAGFANLTYKFTDRFSVELGGRESELRQSISESFIGPFNYDFFGVTGPVIQPQVDVKNNAFTYLVAPTLKLAPDFMVYARLASGYRAGGPNPGVGVPPKYRPDKTENYELGTKGDFLNHIVSVDASLYYIDWKDVQLSFIDPVSGLSYYGNGGRAKSQGLELTVDVRPVQGLTVAGWVSFNEAVLTENFPPAVINAGTYGMDGDRLPYSSRFSGSFSLDEEVPLYGGIRGFLGGVVSYMGDRQGAFLGTAQRQDLPAYARTDLHMGVKFDGWKVNAFVNNVADARGLLDGGLDYSPPNGYLYIQPRTFGLNVIRTF